MVRMPGPSSVMISTTSKGSSGVPRLQPPTRTMTPKASLKVMPSRVIDSAEAAAAAPSASAAAARIRIALTTPRLPGRSRSGPGQAFL